MHYEDANGKAHSIDSDRLIVSIGRVPNTEGLTLDAVGLAPDERGFIPVTTRSEERRVGKECRSRWSPYH